MISFIIPTSDNLEYVQLAYKSIREYAGFEHEIIILDDASTDGTWEWLESFGESTLKTYRTYAKVGHTMLYNVGASMATNDIITILHADMVIGPSYVQNLLKHMKPGVVVSATRIEPPLHPEGNEKITKDFGMYPDDFREHDFTKFVREERVERENETTCGIFAPWDIHKDDYMAIGGHDELFAPYPYEDSDIFQRFMLAGYEIVQERDALVYHFTCRDHKWTDTIGEVHDKFEEYELSARRNWFRKWKAWVDNDEYGCPIIHPIYNIGITIENADYNVLAALEPHFDYISVGIDEEEVQRYIEMEQPRTLYDLDSKIIRGPNHLPHVDIHVRADYNMLDQGDFMCLVNLTLMIEDMQEEFSSEFGEEGDILPAGEYEVGHCSIEINSVQNYALKVINNVNFSSNS